MIKIFTFSFLMFFSHIYCSQPVVPLGWSFHRMDAPRSGFPAGSLLAFYKHPNTESLTTANLKVALLTANGFRCHIITEPNGSALESISVQETIMTGSSPDHLNQHGLFGDVTFQQHFYNPVLQALVFVYVPLNHQSLVAQQ